MICRPAAALEEGERGRRRAELPEHVICRPAAALEEGERGRRAERLEG